MFDGSPSVVWDPIPAERPPRACNKNDAQWEKYLQSLRDQDDEETPDPEDNGNDGEGNSEPEGDKKEDDTKKSDKKSEGGDSAQGVEESDASAKNSARSSIFVERW